MTNTSTTKYSIIYALFGHALKSPQRQEKYKNKSIDLTSHYYINRMQISIAALGELLICICSVSFTHFSSRENPQSLTNSHDHSNKSTLGRVDSERWSYPIFDLKSARDAGPTPPVDSSVPHCVVRGGSND